ncbi:MAG: DUF5050 domain-containing protein [Myxococcota bacterium]
MRTTRAYQWCSALLLCVTACGRSSLPDLAAPDDTPPAPETPEVLATGTFPFAITADDTAVYWHDFDNGSVHAIPLSGAPAQTLLPSRGTQTPVYGLAVADDGVYQCDSQRGLIQRIPLAGGDPATIATNPCMTLAVDGAHLYWSNAASLTAPVISKWQLGSSANPEGLGTPGTGSGIITVRDGWVYFTDWLPGTVSRIATTGGEPELIATTEAAGPWGVIADDSFVYVADNHADHGGIIRIPLAGGPAEPLATGQLGAHAIAIDDGNLYWTNTTGGTVMKLAPGAGSVAIASDQDRPMNLVVTRIAVYWTNRGGTVAWVAK